MSRRYALIEDSGDRDNPDAVVLITKNFRAVVKFAVQIPARKTLTGKLYRRNVYEMPGTWREPNEETCRLLAMSLTSHETPVTWQDALAFVCVQVGKHVDLSSYSRG